MPADRRHSSSAAKLPKGALMKKPPQKTERTHEENQERAYIAASRRSDRSLEARIESARRASEIHKKRTGRGLRVTEQDVINEDMYEEEEDDLPTQYQRLNAHLQTSSWAFNKKLHDYIATQHGVRNMFLHQQFGGQHMQPFPPNQFQPNVQMQMMNQPMLPPQNFNPGMQNFHPSAQVFSPSTPTYPPYSPQGFQHQPQHFAPVQYPMVSQPQHQHQRSASVSTPVSMDGAGNSSQANSASPTAPGGRRRMSAPFHPTEVDAPSRPSLSRSTTAHSSHPSPISPGHALSRNPSSSNDGLATPTFISEQGTVSGFQFPTPSMAHAQVTRETPLSMSMPLEARQIIGSALDPNDPHTAFLMAGSDDIPQPTGTYFYNPNLSPKNARKPAEQFPMVGAGLTQTLAPETSIKQEVTVNPSDLNSQLSADNFFNQPVYTPSGFGFTNYFDSTSNYNNNTSQEFNDLFEDSLVNWDQ